MKSLEEWKREIEVQIKRLKLAKRRNYYNFSVEMNDVTAAGIITYFSGKGYEVKVEKCPLKKWDIMISWN